MTADLLRSRLLVICVTAAVLVASVAPVVAAMVAAGDHALIGPADVFAFIMRQSPVGLVFPLIVSLPFAVVLTAQISQRWLAYTRPRAALGKSIRARFAAAAITGGVIGFLIVLLVFVWAFVIEPRTGLVTFQPDLYGLVTPEQIHSAERGLFTFAQLLTFGDWTFGLGYSLFVGVAGALYSMVTTACLFIMTNRFLAMAVPWIVSVAVYFVMAVLDLALVSPNAFFPFNMTQASMALPMVPLGALAVTAGVLTWVVFAKARTWDSWQ